MLRPSIIIRYSLNDDGIVSQLVSTGHAPLEGLAFSPECAAVSSALRSFGRLLVDTPGIELSGQAAQAGYIKLKIGKTKKELRQWLRGACDLLIKSLKDAALESNGVIVIEKLVEE